MGQPCEFYRQGARTAARGRLTHASVSSHPRAGEPAGRARKLSGRPERCKYICDKEIATGLNDIGNVNRHMVPKDPEKGKTAEVKRLKQRHIDVVAAAQDCVTNGTTASEANIALLAACMGDDRVQRE